MDPERKDKQAASQEAAARAAKAARKSAKVRTTGIAPVGTARDEQRLATTTKLASRKHVARLFEARRDALVVVDQPLVLIAQPTRSGGTLLSQLVDGHPELHAHPYELEIGYPEKNAWPTFDLHETAKEWFAHLAEPHAAQAFANGYHKDRPAEKLGYDDQRERFPFLLVPSFQRMLFLRLVRRRPVTRMRDVLDCYLTSYFNAWLDNQNLYGGPKRWVVGFRSGLGTPENVTAFFADYPDGRHVTCVREAKGWVASRMRLWGERTERDVRGYAELWCKYAAQRFDAVERFGDRVFLCTFEHLLTETERVMRALAAWLGIAFDPILLQPTFNRFPIRANSSFRLDKHGVVADVRDNWRQVLAPEDAALIDEMTAPLYARAAAVAERQLAAF